MTASFPLRILCNMTTQLLLLFSDAHSATVSDTTASHFLLPFAYSEEMHHNHL